MLVQILMIKSYLKVFNFLYAELTISETFETTTYMCKHVCTHLRLLLLYFHHPSHNCARGKFNTYTVVQGEDRDMSAF